MSTAAYTDAGADLAEGPRFGEAIYRLMQSTFDGRVIERPGGFGALFALDFEPGVFRRNYRHPVLVGCTDGVGAKLKVAFMTGRHGTVGVDLVAACVNDVVALGAEPLFFLDYLATGGLEPAVLEEVVAGIAEGCRQAGCALIGGETAEMPGLCPPGEYDMAGFLVGVVDRGRVINGDCAEPGDVVVGLPSSGLHSNGYSLVRRVFFEQEKMAPDRPLAEFGIARTLGEELLEPTRIYVRAVRAVLSHYRVKHVVRGIAHVAEGGLTGSLARAVPPGCAVVLDASAWQRHAIFDAVRTLGDVSCDEMYGTFNMGVGLALVVSPYYADSIVAQLREEGEDARAIGRVVRGDRKVTIEHGGR